jgi:hypothetical protein
MYVCMCVQPDYSDRLSAVDNMMAVEAFFKRFPDMQQHDIYLGESVRGGGGVRGVL